MCRHNAIVSSEPGWRRDQSGTMDSIISAKQCPMSPESEATTSQETFTMPQGTTVQDMKYEGRLTRLKFSSNVQGGFYQQGDILVHVGPDDGTP